METRLATVQLTQDEAIALGETAWWETAEPLTIARFQLSQEKLCMDFAAFHQAVETCLGRGVFTHEFAFPDLLWAELHEHRRPPTLQEIMSLIPKDKIIIVRP
ncbi:MAG TPA: hypothetical protein VI542_06095 [Candidatus Tectomicrobia bacterium]